MVLQQLLLKVGGKGVDLQHILRLGIGQLKVQLHLSLPVAPEERAEVCGLGKVLPLPRLPV